MAINAPVPEIIWVMGSSIAITEDGGNVWEVNGIYLDEQSAAANCTKSNQFIAPIAVGQEPILESMSWPGSYYPLEKDPSRGLKIILLEDVPTCQTPVNAKVEYLEHTVMSLDFKCLSSSERVNALQAAIREAVADNLSITTIHTNAMVGTMVENSGDFNYYFQPTPSMIQPYEIGYYNKMKVGIHVDPCMAWTDNRVKFYSDDFLITVIEIINMSQP